MSKTKTFNSSSGVRTYADTYNTFSGCDMTVIMSVPIVVNGEERVKKYVVGELQTITYSTSMNRQPIRSISNVNAKDYVLGQRTIAGSMVFSVFDRHFAQRIIDDLNSLYSTGVNVLVDELPPMDINIVMANEYGSNSKLVIYGVRFVNEGQVMSVSDIYMENTYQYVATGLRYADPTRNKNKVNHGNKIVPSPIDKDRSNSNIADSGKNIIFGNPWDEVLDLGLKEIIDGSNTDIDKWPIYPNIIDPTLPPDDISYLPTDFEHNEDYQFVALIVSANRWIGDKKEVIIKISPNRKTGQVFIEGINNDIKMSLPYSGKNVVTALPEGRYYCRYIDKLASSTIEYLEISKKNKLPDYTDDDLNNDNDEDQDQDSDIKDKDTPIIEDLGDDTITITDGNNDDIVLIDKNGNKHKLDKDQQFKNLIPGDRYTIVHGDKRIDVIMDMSKLDLLDKLEESMIGYFDKEELDLITIMEETKINILKGLNIIEASFKAIESYKELHQGLDNSLIDHIMFHASMLHQKKKIKINNSSNMPVIANYSTNKIRINQNAEKVIVHKMPTSQNPPEVVIKDDLIKVNKELYYNIKDFNNSLYKIYTIDKDGRKSPSIIMYANIVDGDIMKVKDLEFISLEQELDKMRVKIQDKRIVLPPLLQDVQEDKIIFNTSEVKFLNGSKMVLCNLKYIEDNKYYIKKEIQSDIVFFDSYDLSSEESTLYAYWIEDKYGRIVSDIYPFSLNKEHNDKNITFIKDKFYNKVILSKEFKALNPLTRSIIEKTLEDSSLSEREIKHKFIKSMLNNKINNVNFNDDIIFMHNYFYSLLNGVKKVYSREAFNIEDKVVYFNNTTNAKITIICPITLSIKEIEVKEKINLNSFKNKIIFIEAHNKTYDIFYTPFRAFVGKTIEVI